MPYSALAVFGIAALGGLVMAARIWQGQFAPWALSLLHAALGATGLVLVALLMLRGTGAQTLAIAFTLLLIAALGGFFLASFHLRQKMPPRVIVAVHAAVAIAGFLTLVRAVVA